MSPFESNCLVGKNALGIVPGFDKWSSVLLCYLPLQVCISWSFVLQTLRRRGILWPAAATGILTLSLIPVQLCWPPLSQDPESSTVGTLEPEFSWRHRFCTTAVHESADRAPSLWFGAECLEITPDWFDTRTTALLGTCWVVEMIEGISLFASVVERSSETWPIFDEIKFMDVWV